MSLLAIKQYFLQVKVANLASICEYFKLSPELLRDMLGHWIRKGKIRRFNKTAACGKQCVKCDPGMIEIYEWCLERLPTQGEGRYTFIL